MPQTQYQQVGDGVSHLGRVAQNIALGLAQQRYQQRQQQEMMQLRNQQLVGDQALQQQQGRLADFRSRESVANTGYKEAQTGAIDSSEASKQALKDAVWQYMNAQAGSKMGVDMGPRQDIAAGRIAEAMAGLSDSARTHLPENMAQMSQMGDPRMQQMLATGTKMTASVSPGATLFDTLNLQPLISSPRTLSEGQVLRPNEAGQQGLPKTFTPSAGNRLSLNTALQLVGDPTKNSLMPTNVMSMLKDFVGRMDRSGRVPELTNAPAGLDMQGGGMVNPQPVVPNSQEEFNALPPGSLYINPADGKQYRKN